MSGVLDGRVAVVTGASRGIGRAITLALAVAGADLVVAYRESRDRAEAVALEVAAAGRRAIVLQADVARSADVERLVDGALAAHGRLDAWVNNAGADILTGAAAGQPDETRWDQVMTVDLKGTWLCSRAAGRAMRERDGGVIVNLSWDHVAQGLGDATAAIYAAAKGGVAAMSRCLARELAPRVRVNVVAPGWIMTDWLAGTDEATRRAVVERTPLGRWGTPEDVAAAVVYLVSPAASFVTGETLLVGGGAVMG